MTWRKTAPGSDEPEGYLLGSGIKPDLEAALLCKECKSTGYLVCAAEHLVVHKQRHTITGEERIVNQTKETCFGHLCKHCQPIGLLVLEKVRQR